MNVFLLKLLSTKGATPHCPGNPGDSLLSVVAASDLCLMKPIKSIVLSYT